MMSRNQSQQEKSNTTKYTTLKETPFAVSGSANVAVRPRAQPRPDFRRHG